METPLLRVSRPVSACARCRSAKIRCDGKVPACSACERVGKAVECSASKDRFAKGKELSYVASLEAKIEKLEQEVSRIRILKTQNSSKSVLTRATCSPKIHRSDDTSEVDELVSDFGYLSVNATASGYYGFTKEMSLARLVLSTACMREIPKANDSEYPVRELSVVLVKECFGTLFATYPVLSETSVFSALEAVNYLGGRFSSSVQRWNIRMVFAIAWMNRSRTTADEAYRESLRHVYLALEERESVIQPGSIATVQSLLLLVVFSLLNPLHFSYWYLLGVTSRIMIDIGLHQELPGPCSDSNRLDLRRRIFYCVYSLDRAISLALIRAFSFTDDSVRVDLPRLHTKVSSNLDRSSSIGPWPPSALQHCEPFIYTLKVRLAFSPHYHSLLTGSSRDLPAAWHERVSLLVSLWTRTDVVIEDLPELTRYPLLSELYYICILFTHPFGPSQNPMRGVENFLLSLAIHFARYAWKACQATEGSIFLSSLDLLRATFVGDAFLSLSDNLNGALKQPDDIVPNNFPLDVSLKIESDIVRAKKLVANAAEELGQAVNFLHQKFGGSHMNASYKVDSEEIHKQLSLRSLMMAQE